MASAFALEYGLRLRSRRVRSGRSHRLSLGFAVAVIAIGSGIGVGVTAVQLATEPGPVVVDAATLDQQRFAADLRPIRAEIEQGVAQTGLVVATYQNGEIDRSELQRRLAAVLSEYGDAATQLAALAPPAELDVGSSVAAYRQTVDSLSSASAELSKAYDDNDESRVAAALGMTLRATAQLHDLSEVTSPPR